MKELKRKYANQHSKFIKIHDLNIHYRDEGEGFPIILLHGAFSSLHTFDTWTKDLIKDYRVIRYDLPGFALTGASEEHNYSIENHIKCLKGLLDALKIDKCYIAGNSLGGWISWEATLKYPELFERLILISSAGFLDSRSVPLPFKMAKTPFLNRIVKYAIKKNILEKFIKQVYYDQSKVTKELSTRYFELFSREENVEAFFHLVNTSHKDNTHKLHKIETPTLIIWGENDQWLPIANSYRFANAIPNSSLTTYSNVGHVPMEEIPYRTLTDVYSFLKLSKTAVA